MCESKQKYFTRSAAIRSKKAVGFKFRNRFVVYKCPACDGFHIATKKRGRKYD